MQWLIENKALEARFQAAAVEQAQVFDIQRLTKKLISVYEQAVEYKRNNRLAEINALG